MTPDKLTSAQRSYVYLFEQLTGLPVVASREELEVLGAQFVTSKPIKINERDTMTQYMIYRPDATSEMFMWERKFPEQIDFTIMGRMTLGDLNPRAQYPLDISTA